jgi:hypothetical protein
MCSQPFRHARIFSYVHFMAPYSLTKRWAIGSLLLVNILFKLDNSRPVRPAIIDRTISSFMFCEVHDSNSNSLQILFDERCHMQAFDKVCHIRWWTKRHYWTKLLNVNSSLKLASEDFHRGGIIDD